MLLPPYAYADRLNTLFSRRRPNGLQRVSSSLATDAAEAAEADPGKLDTCGYTSSTPPTRLGFGRKLAGAVSNFHLVGGGQVRASPGGLTKRDIGNFAT